MNSNGVPTALWVVPVPDFGGVARHVVDMARAGLPGFNLVVLAPEGKLTERLELLSSFARRLCTATWRMRMLWLLPW